MPDHQLADKELFPEWLHVLLRVEDVGVSDIWSGRLHAIKEHIQKMEIALVDTETRILDRMLSQSGAQHEKLMEKVTSMAESMCALQVRRAAVVRGSAQVLVCWPW